MKRFFLIDLENVGRSFLQGIDKLTVEDTIVICHNMTIKNTFKEEIDKKLLLTKANVQRMEIANVSKNAMDFEIMIELGYLIAQYGNGAKYFIVSNDTGFDVAADFPKNHEEIKNTEVRRITTLVANFSEEERIADLEEKVAALLPDFPKKVVKIVRQGIDQSRTPTQLNNFLQKHLYRDYTKVFPIVRHLLDEKEDNAISHTREKNWRKIVSDARKNPN